MFKKLPDLSDEVDYVISGEPLNQMTNADKRILFIPYPRLIHTLSTIAENIDVPRQTVSKRLSTLQAAEFVEKISRGKYKITRRVNSLYLEIRKCAKVIRFNHNIDNV